MYNIFLNYFLNFNAIEFIKVFEIGPKSRESTLSNLLSPMTKYPSGGTVRFKSSLLGWI